MTYHISVWSKSITIMSVNTEINVLFTIPWNRSDLMDKNGIMVDVSNTIDWRVM